MFQTGVCNRHKTDRAEGTESDDKSEIEHDFMCIILSYVCVCVCYLSVQSLLSPVFGLKTRLKYTKS
jgi:hypothetical protein